MVLSQKQQALIKHKVYSGLANELPINREIITIESLKPIEILIHNI